MFGMALHHHPVTLHFLVNDVFMCFFFGLAVKEIAEAVQPGGSLYPPKRALNPIAATLGGVLGPVAVYFVLLASFSPTLGDEGGVGGLPVRPKTVAPSPANQSPPFPLRDPTATHFVERSRNRPMGEPDLTVARDTFWLDRLGQRVGHSHGNGHFAGLGDLAAGLRQGAPGHQLPAAAGHC